MTKLQIRIKFCQIFLLTAMGNYGIIIYYRSR